MKKITAIILFICIISILSCVQDNASGDNNTPNTPSYYETETDIERPNIPEGTNYGGYVVTVLVPEPAINNVMREIYVEEESGDTLDDAVFKRNRLVEEMLNIEIKTVTGPGHWLVEFPQYVLRIIQADENAFDIIDGVYQPLLAYQGCLENLYKVPNMNLSKPWWDQRMIEDLSFKNSKLYYIIGDIGHYGMSGVFSFVFNKQICDDNGYEYPYEKVRQGTWTFEEFSKLIKTTVRDLNGDGSLDHNDQWGYWTNSGGVTGILSGSGELRIGLDRNGVPFLNSLNERHIQVVNAAAALMSDPNYVLLVENIKGMDGYEAVIKMMDEGRVLFFVTTVQNIPNLRSYEYDFGIIPNPKFDEKQDRYYNTATSYSSGANSFSIPVTNPDLARTGMILEALSGYSTDIIIPALIDVALKSKFTRDADSGEMIEIILGTKFFDIVTEYGWGGIAFRNLYWDIYSDITAKGAGNFTSDVAKYMERTEQDLEDFINTFDELN